MRRVVLGAIVLAAIIVLVALGASRASHTRDQRLVLASSGAPAEAIPPFATPVFLEEPSPSGVAEHSERTAVLPDRPEEVPEALSRLLVTMVDSDSGAAIETGCLVWKTSIANGTDTRSDFGTEEGTGVRAFMDVPREGELKFTGVCTPYDSQSWNVRIQPGGSEVTLQLAKAAMGRITTVGEDEADTHTVNLNAYVATLDGNECGTEYCVRESPPQWKTFKVSTPGRYVVKWSSAPDGFLIPDDRVVDLSRDTITDVVVRLTRKP